MHIDFVSDIACPWCAVGLNALERALEELAGEIEPTLAFQPFELNPTMGAEGADTVAYLGAKYGIGAEQIRRNQVAIRERGAAVGFAFGERSRVWNTFDAHRLLHWAGLPGPAPQRALKRALLQAYHGEGRNPAAREVLLEAAAAAGLDATEAAAVIDDRDCFAPEVREAEAEWQQAGIRSVPSVVLDRRFLIQGGQPPEVFEDALRRRLAAAD
jgi:predicted DsbA family dithiol-disulfide isomerase